MTPLGARHAEVRRLRALLRDSKLRASEGVFVLEGPRVVAGALDRDAGLDVLYIGPGAHRSFAPLVQRARDHGVAVEELRDGVIDKVATTRTPQPIFAVAPLRSRPVDDLGRTRHVVVTVDVADPGNLGTILRSAEASGADGVVVCGGNSVDLHHPKVVRSSAGAIFGLDLAEHDDPRAALDAVGEGRRRLAARVGAGAPYDEAGLDAACALVVGNEARGIDASLDDCLDGAVHVPMAGAAESLNVAMAATVLCFEAARQRRAAEVRS